MGRILFLLILFSGGCARIFSQAIDSSAAPVVPIVPDRPLSDKVYKIRPGIDLPLSIAGTAWTLYGFSVIYGRDTVPFSELASLDRQKINGFDRSTSRNYSDAAKSTSDLFFYGSMPLPLLLFFDRKIRNDGVRVGLLYLESMAVTGTIYTISAMSANRFRPYAYNPEVPISTRSRGGARNSFFAGHVAVVGTSTFFMAQVINHYHPAMKNKWILYAAATAATVTTGVLRIKAGQHFPTDVIVGSLVGPAVGILVPHFHRNKAVGSKLTLIPRLERGGGGFTAMYRF